MYEHIYFDDDEGDAHAQRLFHEFRDALDPRLKAWAMWQASWMYWRLAKRFVVTCVVRTQEENKAVNGISNSSHLTARALDIRSRDLNADERVVFLEHGAREWGQHGLLHLIHHKDHFHANINYPYILK